MYYISLILSAIFAATATYILHNKYAKVSPVLASATLTLIITLVCHYYSNTEVIPIQQIPYVFIGGSFIGMSTRKKTKTIMNITLASLFFSLIYFKSSQFFQGYGGALGLSACISVLIVVTSSKLFIRSKHYIRKKRIQQ